MKYTQINIEYILIFTEKTHLNTWISPEYVVYKPYQTWTNIFPKRASCDKIYDTFCLTFVNWKKDCFFPVATDISVAGFSLVFLNINRNRQSTHEWKAKAFNQH